MLARVGLRTVALGYLALVLVIPCAMIVQRTFQDGLPPVWDALTDPAFLHALQLTLLAVAIAVPANTIFGVMCALVLVRRRPRGAPLFTVAIGLPLALSPVVVGLALILVYGKQGWFGEWFVDHGFPIIFSTPGIILATIFVTLPFVVREVVPVLREVGIDQDEAAWTLGASKTQAFWRITLPAIRWGVAYGVVLTTARALGEYGAVAVVSGRLQGETETATLRVQERWEAFDVAGAYAISIMLATIAILVLVAMTLIRPKEERV